MLPFSFLFCFLLIAHGDGVRVEHTHTINYVVDVVIYYY